MSMVISTETDNNTSTSNTSNSNTSNNNSNSALNNLSSWKKVEIDTTKDHILLIQNASIIPNSHVYISFTTSATPDPNNAFMLTGPNQWEGRLKSGTNLFYKEDHGGQFVITSFPVEKLENYDIPTQHVNIKAQKQSILCPEGSYFVIQNKSETPFGISIDGEGTFILTENQMLSFTFAIDNTVVIHGTGQDASYMIAEAPSLTQLSKEVQARLDEMHSAHQHLMSIIVTRNEFIKYKKYGETGKWSEESTQTGFNIKFKNDFENESKWIHKDSVIEIISIVEYSLGIYNRTAYCRFILSFNEDMSEVRMNNYYCDDVNIRQYIRKMITKWTTNEDAQNFIGITFQLDPTSNIRINNTIARLRTDSVKYVHNDTDPTYTNIVNLDVFKVNEMITFTDDEYYTTKMISKFDHKESDLFAQVYEHESLLTATHLDGVYNITDTVQSAVIRYNNNTKELYIKCPTINGLTRPICFTIVNTHDYSQSYTINVLYSTESTDIQTGSDLVCTYRMYEGRFSKDIYNKFFKRFVDMVANLQDKSIYKLLIKY